MTLQDYLKNNISIYPNVNTWEEAIEAGCSILEKNKIVTKDYKNAIISNVEELGPYIVLAPNIALPHARPEAGALKVGASLVKLDNPVMFKDKQVQLVISFAAIDNNRHLELLQLISELIIDDNKVNQIINAKDADEIYSYL